MNHHKSSQRFNRLRFGQWRTLLGVLIVAAGTGGFLALANEVAQGRAQDFDDWGVRDLRSPENPAVPIGPRWLTVAAQDVTALGGASVLGFVTAAVIGLFAVTRRFTSLRLVLAAVAGGLLITLLLKAFFSRPRPQLVPYLCAFGSSSFPSGHSMMSLVVYCTVAGVLAEMTVQRPLKFYLLATALVLTGLIGASRIYLGVHYPTDILSGWTAGLVWVAICWLLARKADHPAPIDARTSEASAPSVRA